MGIRISSIQSRDQVDIKDPPVSNVNSIKMRNPIPEGIEKPLEGYADFIDKKEQKALRDSQNIRSAMIKNKFADFQNEATMKVMEAEGENTYKAGDIAGKELRDRMNKELEKVPAQYRTEYSNFANDSITGFNKAAQGRMISEGRKAGEKTFTKRADDLTGKIVLAAYDSDERKVLLQELDATTEQYSSLTIGDESPAAKELIETSKRAARSTAIVKTIETLTASGDVSAAKGIAQEYKDTLTSGDLTKAYKYLAEGKKKRDLDTAQVESNKLFDIFGNNEAAASAAVAKMAVDGQLAGDILTRYTARVAGTVRAEERQRKEVLGAAQSKIIGGEILTNEDYAKVDARDAVALRTLQVKVSRGELVERDVPTYNKMLSMYISQPEKFSRQTFTDLQDKLPNTDINTLRRLQEKTLDPLTQNQKIGGFSYILNKYIGTIKAKPGTNRNIEESAAYRDFFTRSYSEAITKLGDRATNAEIANEIEKSMAVYSVKQKDTRNIFQKMWGSPKEMEDVPSAAVKGAAKFKNDPNKKPPTLKSYSPSDIQRMQEATKRKRGRTLNQLELLRALDILRERGQIQTID